MSDDMILVPRRIADILVEIRMKIHPFTQQGEDNLWRPAEKACALLDEAEEVLIAASLAIPAAPESASLPSSVIPMGEAALLLREMTDVAKSLWAQHYRDDAPDWQPLSDLRGVFSQIDNMVTGLSRALRECERDFAAIRRDYGRAAKLNELMREGWASLSDELNHIPGGMHADLEDAARSLALVMDDPERALRAALNPDTGNALSNQGNPE